MRVLKSKSLVRPGLCGALSGLAQHPINPQSYLTFAGRTPIFGSDIETPKQQLRAGRFPADVSFFFPAHIAQFLV